jgi:hypothetical protein
MSWGPERIKLRNWENKPVEYVEPQERDCTCAYDEVYFGG